MKILTSGNIEFSAGNWPLDINKPVLIFIHGASLSKEFWEFQTEELIHVVNTIAIDLPGHGGSSPLSEVSIDNYVESLINFIYTLSFNGRIILCGMSMGGAVVQAALIRQPDLFEAGILINTGARLKVLPMIIELVQQDYDGYLKSLIAFSFSAATDTNKLMPMVDNFTGKCTAEVTLKDFYACNSFDIMNEIPGIDCPVLILSASDDVTTPVKYGEWLNTNIKNSSYYIVNSAGHFSPVEKPGEINRLINDFITGLETQTEND